MSGSTVIKYMRSGQLLKKNINFPLNKLKKTLIKISLYTGNF